MSVPRVAALALIAVAATGVAADCSTSAPSVSATQGAAADTAPASGSHLDAAAFAAALQRPGTVVLDVRTPAEFGSGHLPGAVNLDIESPDFATRLAQLDPSVAYAVYCRSGNRSGVALEAMDSAGFTAAYDLRGGIGEWQRADGKIVTD